MVVWGHEIYEMMLVEVYNLYHLHRRKTISEELSVRLAVDLGEDRVDNCHVKRFDLCIRSIQEGGFQGCRLDDGDDDHHLQMMTWKKDAR